VFRLSSQLDAACAPCDPQTMMYLTDLLLDTTILSDEEMERALAFHDFWLDYLEMLRDEELVEERAEEEEMRADQEACSADPYAYHGVRRGDF
jgi:hypothetical protein